MKIETLNDLKIALHGLNDEQLSQKAILYLADEGAEQIASVVVTDEDEYLTDEGFAPVSTFEAYDHTDSLENYEIRKAGYVYLLNE